MNVITVACAQQRMQLCEEAAEYRQEVLRFVRMAKSQGAQLIVFPELSGLMLASLFLPGLKRGLLRRAGQGRQATGLGRLVGRVAGTAAGALGGGLQGSLPRLLEKHGHELETIYRELFSEVARQYEIAILAGSCYLPDSFSDEVRHRTFLFASDGSLLGGRDKVALHGPEATLASQGHKLPVFDLGPLRVGVLMGVEALYPEIARLLAYRGAEALLGIAACPDPTLARKVRAALHARAQENQLYALGSFLVGFNPLGGGEFIGRSSLLAPLELSPQGDGLLKELGSPVVEGLITAPWDLNALHALWLESDLRQAMPVEVWGEALAEHYRAGETLTMAYERTKIGIEEIALPAPPEPAPPAPAEEELSWELLPPEELPPTVSPTLPPEEKS